MVRKATELRPVMVRLPEGLRRRLAREAEENARSMNSEIIRRLEKSFEKDDQSKLVDATATATAAKVSDAFMELFAPRLATEEDIRMFLRLRKPKPAEDKS